jgi:hypothetical protein
MKRGRNPGFVEVAFEHMGTMQGLGSRACGICGACGFGSP